MCRTYGVALTPPLTLLVPLILGTTLVATVLIIVAISTLSWEEVVWDVDRIRMTSRVDLDESYFNTDEGFHVIVTRVSGSNDTMVSYLRDWVGGVWKTCDKTSSKLQQTKHFRA